MIMNLSVALLAAVSFGQQDAATLVSDTTFAVAAGVRISVRNMEGVVRVDTWERNEVRVVSRHDPDDHIEIRQGRSSVSIRVRSRFGPSSEVEMDVTVPAKASLELTGVELDIHLDGVGGDVSAHTTEGDIEVIGGSGNVAVNAVDGDVTLSGARGNIAVVCVDGEISLRDIEGTVAVRGVDGDIILDDIRSSNLAAMTVDGDISFSGPIRDGGQYSLSTHDGDLTVKVPSGTNARVGVSTFSGEFESDFPVTLDGDIGRRKFSFTLGTGKASLELSAFDGLIRLIR